MSVAALLLAVVLSDPTDRYAALAHEIGAQPDDSQHVVWVVAPENLTDDALRDALSSLGPDITSFGVITGPTIESARELWMRGGQLRPPHPRRIVAVRGGGAANTTRDALVRDLNTAAYVTFDGPGAANHWLLGKGEKLTAGDVPPVDNLVVGTNGPPLGLRERDGVAMVFIAKGVAGYAGFASEQEGTQLPGANDTPFRYSWRRFPIGTIVAMQNRAAPLYVWLGNPAAAFHAGPPYIHRGPNHYQAPEGWIPLRLLNAAKFTYVEIDGLAAADDDRILDPRIVIANEGNDKLVLFRHAGGEFHVRLAERAPWQRTIAQRRTTVIAVAALLVLLVLLLVLMRRLRVKSGQAL